MVHVVRRLMYFYSVIIHAHILNGDIFHETEQIKNDALTRSERSIEHVLSFLPVKFTQFLNVWLLNTGYKRTQISRKTNSFTSYRVAGNFSWEFNFADVGFFRFWGEKKSRIWISDFTLGNNFSRNSCTLFESNTKMESRWSFSLHCLQPNTLKFSNVRKGVNFCWIFVGGSLFSDLIIADQWKICEIRDN